MTEQGMAVRPEIRIVAGRWFKPGLSELVVGRSAQGEFRGLGVGDKVKLRRGEWTVVGVFESGNGLQGSLLTDAKTLMSAYLRAQFSSVTVRMKSPAAFDAFKAALTTNPALSVNPIREVDYYSRLSADVSGPMYLVSFVLGGIMAVGALFGALNTMYTTVSNRRVEIATLRAIGFGGGCVVTSILAEAMILAAVGGLVGAGIAWLLLSGNTFGLGAKRGFGGCTAPRNADAAGNRSGMGLLGGLPGRIASRPARGTDDHRLSIEGGIEPRYCKEIIG